MIPTEVAWCRHSVTAASECRVKRVSTREVGTAPCASLFDGALDLDHGISGHAVNVVRKKMRENKLVVLGAGGVGKTSLVVQFLEGFFATTYKPTVEDYYRHTIQMPDGIFHTVEILDTAGSHHFPAMRELSIRSGKGFVLVFSLDSLQSFHEAVQLWEMIIRIRGNHVPLILVGNKSDLVKERQISQEMALKCVTDVIHNSRYIETSAKYNINVGQLFVELLQQAQAIEEAAAMAAENRRPSRRLSRRLSSLPVLNIRRKSSSAPKITNPEITRGDTKCTIL